MGFFGNNDFSGVRFIKPDRDGDFYILTDHKPAGLNSTIPFQSVIKPIDRQLGLPAREEAAACFQCAGVRRVEGYFSGHVANGQVAMNLILFLTLFLKCGVFEFDLRKLLGVEEVLRSQVVVPPLVFRIDAGCFDGGLNRGIGKVVVRRRNDNVVILEDPVHLGNQHMGHGEFDLRMRFVGSPWRLCGDKPHTQECQRAQGK